MSPALPALLRLSVAAAFFLAPAACSRDSANVRPPEVNAREVQAQEVEAACGTCQFGLPGDGCALAVRIDGGAHFVDGAGLDDHGDAHAADGMCNAVRSARVSGRLEGERFVASSFELLPR